MTLVDAEVYTVDEKSAGRIVKVNTEYFIAHKRGLVTDEECRIPLDAISYLEAAEGDMIIVGLALNEKQLKHGHEFVKGKPNSEFVSDEAESEPKAPTGKQVIYYEAMEPLKENIAAARHSSEGLLQTVEYNCDMCMEKFESADDLQKHRSKAHKEPIGI
jgi:hypothetical protein